MRLRARLAIIAAALTLGATAAAADPTGRYLYVAPQYGFTSFDGDIRFPTRSLKDAGYAGGRLGYQYYSWLALEAAGGVTSSRENAPGGAKVAFWHASGNAVLSMWHGVLGNPYLSLGYGVGNLKSDDDNALLNIAASGPGTVDQGNLEVAAGTNLWVSDRIGVRLEMRSLAWLGKDEPGKPLTHTFIPSVGLTWTFGAKPRDTDVDGVADRHDDCPATPRGATVDRRGCPSDTDGDGVLDGLDQCNGTPRGCVVDANGCPLDADGDGVCDGLDECADTPKGALVDGKGCPSDTDGDGVLDGLDRCGATPTGCEITPDGCPKDGDGDGVCDGLDQCPGTTAGVQVDEKGCPLEYMERETELLDTGTIRLQNVQFETGKADLLPASVPTLDAVGDLLTKWPDLEIEIAGHTDSRGSAELNRKLSLARADTVRAYLLRRFPTLKPEQYQAKGYGPSRPIAPNDTEIGQAQNRRVEFTVLNRGVLIREIERRQQLQKPAEPDTTKSPGGE